MGLRHRSKPNPHRMVKRIEDFKGVDVVLYNSIGSTIESLTATKLAELAIESAKKLHNGTDGISYLNNAIKNGIRTPLTDAYASEVKRLTAVELDEAALLIARRARRAMKHSGPTVVHPFEQVVSVDQIFTLREARTVITTPPLVSVALHPGEGQYPSQTSNNTTQALTNVLKTCSSPNSSIKQLFCLDFRSQVLDATRIPTHGIFKAGSVPRAPLLLPCDGCSADIYFAVCVNMIRN